MEGSPRTVQLLSRLVFSIATRHRQIPVHTVSEPADQRVHDAKPAVAVTTFIRPVNGYRTYLATKRQTQAAKRNIQKAQAAARRKRTIANLPASTRRGLQAEARKGARRGGTAGRALEDRNRQQLYEIAKKEGIPGRSRMGKWDLIDAIRKAR